jgi:RHS repeat-associated protein
LTNNSDLTGAYRTFNLLSPVSSNYYQNNTFLGGVRYTYNRFTVRGQLIPLIQSATTIFRNQTERLDAILGYDANGNIATLTSYNSALPITYTWDIGRLMTKAQGGLQLSYNYYAGTALLQQTTDENGLKTKFYYDGLQQLTKTENRMKDDGTEVQAKTEYVYQYKDANNPYNFVRTTNTFSSVATPLVSESYLDGLGRPIGAMKQNYTPDNLHLKSLVTYDGMGRQDKVYQPFQSSVVGYQDAPIGTLFTQTEYEASPLSRPVKQINVDKTTILTNYGVDTINEVRKFGIANDVISSGAYYPMNTLFKTTMTDENGKQTIVFKDGLGRVVLTRKFLSGQNVDTYNVYDNTGQLVAVLPPGSVSSTGTVTADLIFQYKYDLKNRLIEKKIPGSAAQKFYYDARDLLVLTQDGNMRATNAQKHLATQYDGLGRVLKTGFVMLSPTAGTDVDVATINITDADRLTETHYYPNKSWVRDQGAKVLKNAGTNTPTDFLWSYIERRDACNYTGNPAWTAKQHLMSAYVSKNPILDSDQLGVDWSITGLTGAGQPTMTIRYLFPDWDARQVRTYENYAYDNGMRMTDHRYFYTVDGSGLSAPTFTLNNMVYNYKDQLIEKNIGYRGTNNALQSIDYSYNTRGWLTDINGARARNTVSTVSTQSILTPSMQGTGTVIKLGITPFVKAAVAQQWGQSEYLPPVADNNVDLFSQTLTYDSPETKTGATAQYNGNISSTTWQVAGRAKQAYGFAYDDLNRLTEATSFDITETQTGTSWSSTFSTDNKFKEKLTYDIRGNILTLQRNGLNGGSWTSNGYTAATYGLIDNLTYAYGTGNQLKSIAEASLLDRGFKTNSSATGDQYGYDANGNLIYDKNKYITSIEYNYLNLPMKIVITKPNDAGNSGSIEFVYDATGVKLKKIVKNNDGTVRETWDYVNGVEYKNRILQRVPHSEGAVVLNENSGYEHQYVLRDHLGNTRVTFRDGISKGEPAWDWNSWSMLDPNASGNPTYKDGIVTKDDIVQINHYYPFGLNLEGDWNGAGSNNNNKYLYNGKQYNDDFGIGWYDYGARWYDPSIARWDAVDPLSEKYLAHGTYNYVMNNPMKFTDPTGMSAVWKPEVTVDKDEKGKAQSAHVTVVAEKGDNAETLATFLNVSQDKANELYGTMKDGKVELTNSAIGNSMPGVTAINGALTDVIKNPNKYDGWFDKNYNCFSSAISIANGKTPSSVVMDKVRFRNNILGGKYQDVTDNKKSWKFGHSIMRLGRSTNDQTPHAATYLGTSQDGTIWTFSKGGPSNQPKIESLNSSESEYGAKLEGYRKEPGGGVYNLISN